VIDRRTTARGLLLATAVGAALTLAGLGSASRAAPVPRLIFPLVGAASLRDDFGESRSQGWAHPGNDIMAQRRATAVAAEAGTIKLWTTSASAGCMLYLYGESGTTYQYIHLNNDLGPGNDNRGRCVPGTAYTPGLKTGSSVAAGEAIAFVGDSGDANGLHPHLHFEVHPDDGEAISPYLHLRRALRLLFPVSPTTVTLTLTGTVVDAAVDRILLRVAKVRAFPAGVGAARPGRPLALALPATAQIDTGTGSVSAPDPETAFSLVDKQVIVLTEPAEATLDTALGRPLAIGASRISLAPPDGSP
jgi:hypothetical protein